MSEQADSNPWLINTTDEQFEQDVVTRSLSGLVVVDFWAEWCAPCRMLAPILEKLTDEYAGRFTLVKANTDQTPQAAGQFGVQGIPAVFAVLDGEVIDSFQGVLPEESLRGWLDGLLKHTELSEARRLIDTDPTTAESKLRSILDDDPNNSAASIALADLLTRRGQDTESADDDRGTGETRLSRTRCGETEGLSRPQAEIGARY